MLIQNINAAAPTQSASDGVRTSVNASAPPAEVQQAAVKSAEPSTAQLKNAVDHINKMMQQSNANVEFSVDKDTKQTVIKVVESGTGTLIRQFPTEEAIAISRVIGQMTSSMLVNQKV